MPKLTRWLLKAALLYLILALCSGILLALPDGSLISGLFPIYIHTLVLGWLTQLILGVVLWRFPKYSRWIEKLRFLFSVETGFDRHSSHHFHFSRYAPAHERIFIAKQDRCLVGDIAIPVLETLKICK